MSDSDNPPIRVQRPSEDGKRVMMEDFAAEMSQIRATQKAARAGLDEALPVVVEALTHH